MDLACSWSRNDDRYKGRPASSGKAILIQSLLNCLAVEEVLGVKEVAQLLRCSGTTVEEKARKGELPGLLFGDGGWVFPVGALLKRLDELALEESAKRRAPPPAPKAVAVGRAAPRGIKPTPKWLTDLEVHARS